MQRIYVDSRSRVSGTNEDFEFALPYSIHIPEESSIAIDTICIPISMYTVSEHVNDCFYFNDLLGLTRLIKAYRLGPLRNINRDIMM